MVKKAPHEEKEVAKRPPHREKVQKGPQYSEKNRDDFPGGERAPTLAPLPTAGTHSMPQQISVCTVTDLFWLKMANWAYLYMTGIDCSFSVLCQLQTHFPAEMHSGTSDFFKIF